MEDSHTGLELHEGDFHFFLHLFCIEDTGNIDMEQFE